MRPTFADRLRCPRCRAQKGFAVRVEASDEREIRSGALSCPGCGHVAAIRDGIVDMLHEPPEFVRREADGLGRFAGFMCANGWSREDVVALPHRPDGYWFAQRVLMEQVLDTLPFQPGETILDLGSNTCWASADFARHGLDPTALDIAVHEMQGLRTADWQFEAKDVFFERVLCVMFDLPFADTSFDYVWACEVLHHNHRATLAQTYREVFRVLKPGGKLIVANEPLRTLRTPRLHPGEEVADFEGHEHAYMRHSYTLLARRAGFEVDVRGPRYHGSFQEPALALDETMSIKRIYSTATAVALRKSERLKRAALAARAYVLGGTALHMVCTKPAVAFDASGTSR
jgi:SAM-dependent methyltransferase